MVIRTVRQWVAHGGHGTHLGLRGCECEKRSLGSTLHLEGGRGGSWGSWSEPGGEDGEDEGSGVSAQPRAWETRPKRHLEQSEDPTGTRSNLRGAASSSFVRSQ